MKQTLSLILVLSFIAFAGCATSGRHHSYEYVIEHGSELGPLQKKINDLGKEGWIVQSFTVTDGGYKYFLLKREKVP
jgi:hypothetical protein